MLSTRSMKDIHFLQKLCILTNIFLITPWYNFKSRSLLFPSLSKAYATCICLLKIFFFLKCFIYDRHYLFYSSMLFTQKIVYILFCTVDFFQFLSQILSSVFRYRNHWRQLMCNFEYIDNALHNKGTKVASFWRNYYFMFGVVNVAFWGINMVQFYNWAVLVIVKFSAVFVVGYIDAYNHLLLIAISHALIVSFSQRYKALTRALMAQRTKPVSVSALRQLLKMFRMLHEGVEMFNRMFGYQILFIILATGLHIINMANFGFIHVSYSDRHVKFHITLFNIVMTLFLIIGFACIIFPCDEAVRQSEKFLHLCYKLQEKIPEHTEEGKFLVKMAEQCRYLIPKFNTAGYLKLRKRLIFGLLGTVTTYFIVVVEFNASEDQVVWNNKTL